MDFKKKCIIKKKELNGNNITFVEQGHTSRKLNIIVR